MGQTRAFPAQKLNVCPSPKRSFATGRARIAPGKSAMCSLPSVPGGGRFGLMIANSSHPSEPCVCSRLRIICRCELLRSTVASTRLDRALRFATEGEIAFGPVRVHRNDMPSHSVPRSSPSCAASCAAVPLCLEIPTPDIFSRRS